MPLPARQRAVVARPGVAAPTAAAAVAFLGIAGEPLAMLLLAREATGSFASAGLVVAAYGVTAGLLAPARGRALDRRGMGALIPIATWHFGALAGLLLAAELGAPVGAMIALAAVAGFARSPIFGALRTLWAELVPAEELQYAYALQATVQQTSYLAGTLAVGGMLAVATPGVALAAVTVATYAAVIAFARTAAARTWRVVEPPDGAAGAFRSAGLRTLAATAGLTTVTIGSMGVALTAFATERGATAASGVLLAVLMAGSILGGVTYGSRRWPGSLPRRYSALLALFAAVVALLAAPRSLAPMFAATLIAGVPLAALMTCRFQLIDEVAPAGAANEAALWLSAAEAAGIAAGQALAGALVEGPGTGAAFLLAAAVAVAACLLTLAHRQRLAPLTARTRR